MQCQKIPQRNALINRIAGSEARKSKGYIEGERGSYAENRKIKRNQSQERDANFVCRIRVFPRLLSLILALHSLIFHLRLLDTTFV